MTFDSDYETVLAVKARRDRLDAATEQTAADSEFTPIVRRLGCLRGISTLTGFALAVEIGDWHRFTGNSIGSFVGLTPAEYSSGSSRTQGPITKTGNRHVRRLLVEAAWHHRPRYRPAKTLQDRWNLAPAAARIRGDQGNRRLHHRWVFAVEAPTLARRSFLINRQTRSSHNQRPRAVQLSGGLGFCYPRGGELGVGASFERSAILGDLGVVLRGPWVDRRRAYRRREADSGLLQQGVDRVLASLRG